MTKHRDSRHTAIGGSSPSTAPAASLTSRHLLGIEGLNTLEIMGLIDRGDVFADIIQQQGRPEPPLSDLLRGKTVLNLFFENSTRTKTSFGLAAKRLSADTLDFSKSGSSTSKGVLTLGRASKSALEK